MTTSFKNIFCLIGILLVISACVPASSELKGDPATIGSSTTVGNPAYEPLPELDSGGTLSYSVDASGAVPTVGSVESENYSSGQQVAMSASTIVSMNNSMQNNSCHVGLDSEACHPVLDTGSSRWAQLKTGAGFRLFGRNDNSWGMDAFLSTAHAEASTDVCSQSGVTCCPIEDGAFECYLPVTDMSVSQVSIAIVGTDGALGDVHTETVHSNLKWLANEPTDVTVAGSDVYSVTTSTSSGQANGLAVKTTLDATSGDFLVSGDHEDSNGAYRLFDVTGTRIAYDGNFNVMHETEGIFSYDSTGSLLGPSTITGATAYTNIKNTNHDSEVYFGVEINSSDTAKLYELGGVSDFMDGRFLRYIEPGDTDSSSTQLTHARTLAFDVNSEGYALVVYEDLAGNIRIRASNDDTRFGGGTPIATTADNHDFKDLHFVNDNLALLLDAAQDTVWIVRLNTTLQTVTSLLVPASNGLSVGDNPQKIVFNSDKTRAYVLNANGESVTTLNLKNSDGSIRTLPRVVATTTLADQVAGETLTFSPVAMALSGDTLFVASQGTRALLQIDVSTISESNAADEDNDGDGYTGAEGDCDDTDASLNPTTVWYRDSDGDTYGLSSATELACEQPTGYVSNDNDCDDGDANTYTGASELCDGVDNDCDETIDEDVATLTWYYDYDTDGFGTSATTQDSCSQPTNYVSNSTDCNDASSSINTSQTEVCDDGIDNNCDGITDGGCTSSGSEE